MFKRLDHYLLTHYPKIWQTRIVWVFFIWIVYAALCILGGMSSTNAEINPEVYVMFFFISVTGLILYFIFFTRYNYFKWYGKSSFFDPLLHFFLIFACLLMINSGLSLFQYFSPRSYAESYLDEIRPRNFSWSFTYYSCLITATLIYIFRHVTSRQFVLGMVFSAVFMIFYWLMAAVSGAWSRAPIYFLYFCSLVFMVLSIVLANRPSHSLTVAMMIIYHSVLPFLFSLVLIDAAELVYTNPVNRFLYRSSALLINIVLIQFVTTPIFRRQWGNEG